METKINLIVFDMAGTVVNENNVVYKTVQKVINQKGYPVTLDSVLLYGAGKEKFQAIKCVLEKCTDITLENLEKTALEIFENFKTELDLAYETLEMSSFEGTEKLFSDLQKNNIKVVLNTGYNAKVAHLILKKLNWEVGKTIDALVTADDVRKARPEPDMILKAMEIMKITDSKTVLKIGDSAIDIEEGKNADCGLTIGVLTGAQTEDQIKVAKPDYILNSVTDLKKILF